MSAREFWLQDGGAPEIYERYLVPAIFAVWADTLIERAAVQPGARVLDIACGTGAVTRRAAEHVGPTGSVTGLDLNAGMLAVARGVAEAAGARITWHECDVAAMPFEEGAFDVALCQHGFQYFPDKLAALREIHRALAPGGQVALVVWRAIGYSPGFVALGDVVERHLGAEAAAAARSPFSFSEAEPLRAVIAGAGFHAVTVDACTDMVRFPSPREFARRYATGSPLAGHLTKMDSATQEALVRDVGAALQPYITRDGLIFPIEAHIALARAAG